MSTRLLMGICLKKVVPRNTSKQRSVALTTSETDCPTNAKEEIAHSDRQEVERYVRELAWSPLATQAATLLRLVSMPNITEEEIKLLAELLVESLTGNNAIKMLISALAPMMDNPQVQESSSS
ncbi:hypothetical protein [Ktedonospora formicarum]|uniref:hypothetical protein n=1 Tax=Ktedonospora formicarum TaxID=2778364 RepID=UPI001C69327A|nr:hypothetical protein [Ktedonospora formicarum]